MKRDPKIAGFIREAGLEKAPKGFSEGVMNRLLADQQSTEDMPLLGKRAWVFISISVLLVLILALSFSGQPSESPVWLQKLSSLTAHLPALDLKVPNFAHLNISASIASAFVAIFLLVLFESLYSRRHHLNE